MKALNIFFAAILINSISFADHNQYNWNYRQGFPGSSYNHPQYSGGNHYGSSNSVVHCASDQYRYQECDVNRGYITNIGIQQQYSQAECIQGKSYGTIGSSIWVDNGCRANFNVTTRGWQQPQPNWNHTWPWKNQIPELDYGWNRYRRYGNTFEPFAPNLNRYQVWLQNNQSNLPWNYFGGTCGFSPCWW